MKKNIKFPDVETTKEELYYQTIYNYFACNNLNSILQQIMIDHQILKMFNVAHLSEKVGDACNKGTNPI